MANLDLVAIELGRRLSTSTCPEDFFGQLTGDPKVSKEMARKSYILAAKLVHPDIYADSDNKTIREAEKIFKLLNELWQQCQEKIEQGIYGDKNAIPRPKSNVNGNLGVFKSRKLTYTLIRRIYDGGMCGVFEGIIQDTKGVSSPVIVRVPHVATDNDLMKRESRAFLVIKKYIKSYDSNPSALEFLSKLGERLPTFLESITLSEPSKKEPKVINTFLQVPGYERDWYSLEDIRKQYPKGIDPKIMAFIWNRLLEGLTLAHSAGIVHGGLTPNHILIHAEKHFGQIVDWSASCEVGKKEKPPYLDEEYRDYFPLEIVEGGQSPSPSADIYMSAWNMVYILGGTPGKGDLPLKVDKEIKDLLNRCLQPKRQKRPQSVDDLYLEFRRLTKKLWGPRKFIDFPMKEVI